MSRLNILVAAPTARSKDYALLRYLEAFEGMQAHAMLEGIDLSLFMADNTTPDDGYVERLQEFGVHSEYVHPPNNKWYHNTVQNVNAAWERIIEVAWEWNVDYIFSVESDIILEPRAATFLYHMLYLNEAAVVAHSYPLFKGLKSIHALGIVLFERRLFEPGEKIWERDKWNFEEYLYDKPIFAGNKVMLIDNFIELEHLEEDKVLQHVKKDARPTNGFRDGFHDRREDG